MNDLAAELYVELCSFFGEAIETRCIWDDRFYDIFSVRFAGEVSAKIRSENPTAAYVCLSIGARTTSYHPTVSAALDELDRAENP